MNCLSETLIQHFLDHELPEDLVNEVAKHLKECSRCNANYMHAKESKYQILAFLDEFNSLDILQAIPDFKKKDQKRNLKKYIVFTSVAASILLLILIGIRIENQINRREQLNNITKASYEIIHNVDVNKMIHNKQSIIVITNPDGKVIESSLSE